MTRPPDTVALKRAAPERALAEADELLGAERLERIERYRGGGLGVLSMYLTVPAAPGDAHAAALTKADSLLHEIRQMAEDHTVEHDRRLSLRGDIESIEAIVDKAAHAPGTLAVFSCSGAGLLEVVRLPRGVRDRIVVDETPWIGPLLAVLAEHRRCFAVLVDRAAGHVWEVYLGRVRDLGRLDGRERTDTASAANERFEQGRAEELQKRHFRHVAAALAGVLGADHDSLLVVGGHESELGAFMSLLAHPLRERVIGTFAADDDAATAATVRAKVEPIVEGFELEHQRRSVAQLLEAAAAGGHAAVGLDACLWAGSTAAVRALYVQEGASSPGVVCDRSRWLAVTGDVCPVCGEHTRHTPDVIDELEEAVIEEGGSIQHVRAETELGEHLVACSLRFALPPAG